MKTIFRSVPAWMMAILVGLAAFWWHAEISKNSESIQNVNIEINHTQATQKAKEFVLRWHPEFSDALTDATLVVDHRTMYFIERLSGGGRDSIGFLQSQNHDFVRWHIRLYKDRKSEDLMVTLSPSGKPIGMVYNISDSQTSASLSTEAAMELASRTAITEYGVALNNGTTQLVEHGSNTKPNGRVDHKFVYEQLLEMPSSENPVAMRTVININGSTVASFEQYIEIPEHVQREYAASRSNNKSLWAAGTFIYLGLLMPIAILACIILHKELNSLPLLMLTGVTSILSGLNTFFTNNSGFLYDTNVSIRIFQINVFVLSIEEAVRTFFIMAVFLVGAEVLSRKAFSHHPQLGAVRQVGFANSKQFIGRLLGGYIFATLCLLASAIFYANINKLGWWAPMQYSIEMEILGSPIPWLSPISEALTAGIWEEAAFRAIPLSAAAIFANFLRKKRISWYTSQPVWIGFAVLAQAIAFGLAHANYPQEPFYVRPVELFLPAVISGLIFLWFGLIPLVIYHFAYNLVLMSGPIFQAEAPHLLVSKCIIIVVGLSPLVFALWRCGRARGWGELPNELRNGSWKVNPRSTNVKRTEAECSPITTGLNKSSWIVLITCLFFAFSVAAWFGVKIPSTGQQIDRHTAEAAAIEEAYRQGLDLKQYSMVSAQSDRKSEGARLYEQTSIVGETWEIPLDYVYENPWKVRFFKPSGSLRDRQDEWQFTVTPSPTGAEHGGVVREWKHTIADDVVGARLSQDKAQQIAESTIHSLRIGRATKLQMIGAKENRLPNRTDWIFKFREDNLPVPGSATPTILVVVAGDTAAEISQQIVPSQAWKQEQDEKRQVRIVMVKLFLLLCGALTLGWFLWTFQTRKQCEPSEVHPRFNMRRSASTAAVLFLSLLILAANSWQAFAIQLATDTLISTQVWIRATAIVLVSAFTSMWFAGLMESNVRFFERCGWPRAQVNTFVAASLAAITSTTVISIFATMYPLDLFKPNLSMSVTGQYPMLTAVMKGLLLGITTCLVTQGLAIILTATSKAVQWSYFAMAVVVIAAYLVNIRGDESSEFVMASSALAATYLLLVRYFSRDKLAVVLLVGLTLSSWTLVAAYEAAGAASRLLLAQGIAQALAPAAVCTLFAKGWAAHSATASINQCRHSG